MYMTLYVQFIQMRNVIILVCAVQRLYSWLNPNWIVIHQNTIQMIMIYPVDSVNHLLHKSGPDQQIYT